MKNCMVRIIHIGSMLLNLAFSYGHLNDDSNVYSAASEIALAAKRFQRQGFS